MAFCGNFPCCSTLHTTHRRVCALGSLSISLSGADFAAGRPDRERLAHLGSKRAYGPESRGHPCRPVPPYSDGRCHGNQAGPRLRRSDIPPAIPPRPQFASVTHPAVLGEMQLPASDRVATGRCRRGAPTDPYVLALEHTVPQITVSLRARRLSGKCVRWPWTSVSDRVAIETFLTGFRWPVG